MTHRFELRHVVHGTREEVFRAWIDPARLRRWFVPSDVFRAESAEVDARAGGSFAVRLLTREGSEVRVEGRYESIEAPDRLVFTHAVAWGANAPTSERAANAPTSERAADAPGLERAADAPAPVEAGRVTVDFRPAKGAVELVLVEEGIQDEALAEQLRDAWTGCLARLAGALDTSLDAFFERVTRQPRMHSRFGGLWPDYSDAPARIAGRRELGLLDDEDARRFEHWCEKGFVVLEGACSPEAVEAFRREVDRAWEEELPGVQIEYFADGLRHFAPLLQRYRGMPHKVLDIHGHSQAARDLIFTPPIRRFLGQLFERPPMAFQSLLFGYGTEQAMHQDTAYVLLSSPMEFVGCWIALEDVQPGSGELRYYEGSHRNEEFLWLGRARAKPYDYQDETEFLAWVRERSEARGLPLTSFLPKKGDAVIWHADLVHGGAPRVDRDLTRHSLVTHFCPRDVDPEWYGTTGHSEKLRDVSGGYYCWRHGEDAR